MTRSSACRSRPRCCSTIDFRMDLRREADLKGDRVNIVLSGKFPPCRSY